MNPMKPSHLELTLCKVQARMFEKASDMGIDSESFIRRYMRSNVAKRMDAEWDIIHGLGENYAMRELEIEGGEFPKGGEAWDQDVMYWIGYMYRFWCLSRNIASREVFDIADGRRMGESYQYHVLNCEQAVRNIIEDVGANPRRPCPSDG